MKNQLDIFGKKEFLLFSFGLFLFFLSWPFLSIFDKGNPKVILYYLFFMWAFMIFLLFFIGVRYSRSFRKTVDKNSDI